MKKNIYFFLFVFCLQALRISAEQPTEICLAIAVKNNGPVILDCLNSAKEIVDYVSICDLGCTDRTLSEIEKFAEETGIPVHIQSRNLSEGESLRALALDEAQTFLSESGFPLESTYILLAKPDAICQIDSGFKKENLTANFYSVREDDSSILCRSMNPVLIRSTFSGNVDALEVDSKLFTLRLEVNANEQFRLRKVEREVVTLTKNLKKSPGNYQILFRLAGLHYSLRNYEHAGSLYQKCLDCDQVGDERWFSLYRLGECFEGQNLWVDAQYWYLEAYRNTPTRIEPLRRISTHYRLIRENDLAYIFAKQGQLSTLSEHHLYPIPIVFDYELDEELSICAYYTAHREEGFLATNRILLRRGIPWQQKNHSQQNILFYVKPIKSSSRLPIQFDFPLIHSTSDAKYNPMNPSIVKNKDGYTVICRTVNYTQTGSKFYSIVDLDSVVRTKNFLLQYDQNFSLLSQTEIKEDLLDKTGWITHWISGLEDCRLFDWNDGLWFTCTTYGNSRHLPQISLCKLADERIDGTIQVEKLISLAGPNPERCEKNWLPFVKDGQVHILYSSDPVVVTKPNLETGECPAVISQVPSLDLSSFRGSSSLIPWDNGYLYSVHEVVYRADSTRIYLSRLVYADENFNVKKVSLPFIFQDFGVEFCCGMTLDHSGTQVIFSVGIEDREAYLYFVDKEEVYAMLHPVEA